MTDARTATHTFQFANSSLISRIEWYAPKAKDDRPTLVVRFNSTAVYTYLDVPEATFADFMKSDSPGRYFGQFVKGRYPVLR